MDLTYEIKIINKYAINTFRTYIEHNESDNKRNIGLINGLHQSSYTKNLIVVTEFIDIYIKLKFKIKLNNNKICDLLLR